MKPNPTQKAQDLALNILAIKVLHPSCLRRQYFVQERKINVEMQLIIKLRASLKTIKKKNIYTLDHIFKHNLFIIISFTNKDISAFSQ